MPKFLKNRKMLLLKSVALTAIALFSVVVINVFATETDSDEYVSNKKDYSKFNWKEFYEQNKSYWSNGTCEEDGENCEADILRNQKKFYVKLYKTLGYYQKKGTYLTDQVLLSTVFFDLTPSQFSDNGKEYQEEYGVGFPYIYDSHDTDDEDEDNVVITDLEEDSEDYFKEEKDTIELLTRQMLGIDSTCWGIYGDPTEVVAEDGSKREICKFDDEDDTRNYVIRNLDDDEKKHKCVVLHENRILNYAKYNKEKRSANSSCKKAAELYPEGTHFEKSKEYIESLDNYFNYLVENDYFDNKAHLQNYYQVIFDKANEDLNLTGDDKIICMKKSLCKSSLENYGLYETYQNDIFDVRKGIAEQIVDILNSYGLEINVFGENFSSYYEANTIQSARNSYYWPIGGSEITDKNGIKYADGDPTSVNIISYFGSNSNGSENKGITIGGTLGETNIISIYNGEVINIVNNCQPGDTTCNESYGNAITVSNTNGDIIIYAGFNQIDESITVGSSVKIGQYLGKMGSTGKMNSAHLYFEIRMNGNTIQDAVDPLRYVSDTNPRPTGSGGDFSVHTTSLTKEEFASKLRSYCSNNKCKNTLQNVFVANAELVYDTSIKNNINPEFVVVRAIAEGLSPGGYTNNYWGIGCTNSGGGKDCSKYSSLEDGIAGLANLKIVKSNVMVSEVMSKYAYIGANWYNPGSSSKGGCYYFPYIQEYMSPGRLIEVTSYCSEGAICDGNACPKTNEEDQKAYTLWQVNKNMAPLRYNIFGL